LRSRPTVISGWARRRVCIAPTESERCHLHSCRIGRERYRREPLSEAQPEGSARSAATVLNVTAMTEFSAPRWDDPHWRLPIVPLAFGSAGGHTHLLNDAVHSIRFGPCTGTGLRVLRQSSTPRWDSGCPASRSFCKLGINEEAEQAHVYHENFGRTSKPQLARALREESAVLQPLFRDFLLMRAHRAGSIASVLLRIALFTAPVLGPLRANAADVPIDRRGMPLGRKARGLVLTLLVLLAGALPVPTVAEELIVREIDGSQEQAGSSQESNPVDAIGNLASNNYSFASGINLRGLGSNATLVLLNGQRLAPTALARSPTTPAREQDVPGSQGEFSATRKKSNS
jgi:hypothetical protein